MSALRAVVQVGVAIGLVLLASISPAAASTATDRIGPNQHYSGLVNGQHANAVIYVVCPGPASAGRTGPPAGNQTVNVVRTPKGGGYTGAFAHEIWAQFNDNFNVVGFTRYNTPQAIPTGLQLPCGGAGAVTFTTCFGTLPCSATAEDDVVPVTYENIAV
jgi:hypothetical protein